MQPILMIVAASLAISAPVVCEQDTAQFVQALETAIDTGTRGRSPVDPDPVRMAAIDAGESAIDMLEKFLKPGVNAEARRRAIRALSTIGGNRAVGLLREHVMGKGTTFERGYFASALASTGTPEDIQILIAGLEGPQFGTNWTPIVASALALGVLRAEQAIPALEATASKSSISGAANAARQALNWIRQGQWRVQIPLESEEDLAIATVLRNGIPRTEEAERFHDPDRMKTWHRRGDNWTLEEDSFEGPPRIWLRVHISPDSTRALVSVGMVFGIRNGKGYDFLLKKIDSRWKVTGLHSTWIS